jgi:chemotaxis protein histidine kinase CheA
VASGRDDLLPMFVAEARERLHHLVSLAGAVAGDAGAAGEARRELHTIKGAARMLGLGAIAELCHRAEEELQFLGPDSGHYLLQQADALAALLDALEGGGTSAAPPDEGGPDPPSAVVLPTREKTPSEPRREQGELEVVAERAARLRILAVAAGQLVARLEGLVRAASQAVSEPHPEHALALLATSLRALAAEMDAGQRRLRRVADAQLEALLELQLQPLRPFLQRLARHGRELARSLGKDVEIRIAGEDTRLDRRIVRDLEEALLHLVRNAVDHGAEPPSTRRQRGKPPSTSIQIQAQPVGRRVRLVVSDDGAGIDGRQVREAALRRGLLDPAQAAGMDDQQALRLLFLPGLSTREEASEVSGRGVGLDVVSAVVSHLGGEVTVASTPGGGTAFTVEVPVARRGEMVAVLRVAHVRFALPAAAVRECHLLEERQVVERGGHLLALLGGAPLPFVSVARLFALPGAEPQVLLRGSVAGEEVAIAVDAQEAEAEVLVRPLPRYAGGLAGPVEGIALLPTGEPVVVLSPLRLMHTAYSRGSPPATPVAAAVRVLLVDDSFVTREMERRVLEDAGLEVTTAADAEEALAYLGEGTFDCLVTDVEMPGMDGFELTRQVRRMPALAHLPIVVVTTRDRPEDRLQGLQAGADAYLTKQRLDAGELVKLVRRLGRP